MTSPAPSDPPNRTPAQAWFQPLGWWRERGASANALRLATGLAPEAPLTAETDRDGYTLWHYWAEGHDAHHRFDALANTPALANAAYLQQRAGDGEHPWHRLMLRGQLAAAQAWVKRFGWVDLNLINQHGDDLLLAACWSGNSALVSWLLAKEASTQQADGQGLTALMVALHRCPAETVLELVQAGSDPSARDRQGKNSLHHAATLGLVEVFPILEDAGGEADLTDISGTTASAAMTRTLRSEAMSVEAARTHWQRRYQARLAF